VRSHSARLWSATTVHLSGEVLLAPAIVRARRLSLPSADEIDAAIERKYGCAPYRPRQGLSARS
jgi:hypothetical protein